MSTLFVLQGSPVHGDLLLYLNLLNVVVLTATAALLFRQSKDNHAWNRRKATHDLVFEASLGRFRELRNLLEQKIDIYNDSQTYRSVQVQLTAADHIVLDAILNFLENVCLAVKNNVISESIVYDSLGNILIAYMRWANPYITDKRESISEQLWLEIDPYLDKWGRWNEDSERKLENAKKEALARASDARKKALNPGEKKL